MKKDYRSFHIGVILLMVGILGACKGEDDTLKSPTKSIKVTYIANSGYLIESSDHKILIDALFKTRSRMYGSICPNVIRLENSLDYKLLEF